MKKISGEYSFVDHVYQKARRVLDPAYMESVYTTMRRAYHRDLGKLFRAGAGKTVALYWGPARREDVWTYPHLISEESFRRLADVHGVPVAAVAGETPDYYAPAAMHREAAAALAGALGRLRGSAHDGSDALRAPGSG